MSVNIIGGEYKIDGEKLICREMENIDYSSGRCALYCILRSIGREGDVILLPNYLCDSISQTVNDAGWKYEFYRIDNNLSFEVDDVTFDKKASAILLINYFGLLSLNEYITAIRNIRPDIIIIEDDVQAYYSYAKSIADYSFTSLRKWFPCPDGAFINSKVDILLKPSSKSNWSQFKFAGNVLKNYSDNLDDSIILELLAAGEKLLESEYISLCSENSRVIFANLDLDEIANRRQENAKVLHEALLSLNVRHGFSDTAVPLFIPIFVEDRDNLRKEFYKNNIFTPIHWPKKNVAISGDNEIYNNELSLICDQRYTIEDMRRQVEVLKNFIDGERRLGNIYC